MFIDALSGDVPGKNLVNNNNAFGIFEPGGAKLLNKFNIFKISSTKDLHLR